MVIHKTLADINLYIDFDDHLDCEAETYSIVPLWNTNLSKEKSKAFFDIQNDVTYDDVQLALREGYSNVEHVKRYTTGGMGFDQGKTGNINIIGTIAMQEGVGLGEVGTTTFRSPFTPVSFGSISGVREGSVILPYRHTPVTQWNTIKVPLCMRRVHVGVDQVIFLKLVKTFKKRLIENVELCELE